jgi:hypothetical protein
MLEQELTPPQAVRAHLSKHPSTSLLNILMRLNKLVLAIYQGKLQMELTAMSLSFAALQGSASTPPFDNLVVRL